MSVDTGSSAAGVSDLDPSFQGTTLRGPPDGTVLVRVAGRQRIPTKISFGIILTRINPETKRPEAIAVRSRYTYEFAEFVHGRYSRKYTKGIMSLLNAMTINERLDLYSLDFSQMWYRIWLLARRGDLYNKKHSKFQSAWMRDDSGSLLRRLIKSSRTETATLPRGEGIPWEFPKGKRQSNREPSINCAVRELKEETGIPKRDYQILPGFKRRVSYVHMGVRYVNIYYVAIPRREIRPKVDLGTLAQASEVSEVGWMDIEQIRQIDTPTRRLENTVRPVFTYVKRYFSGRIPARGLVTHTPLVARHETPPRPAARRERTLRPAVARRSRNLECVDDSLERGFSASLPPAQPKSASGRAFARRNRGRGKKKEAPPPAQR